MSGLVSWARSCDLVALMKQPAWSELPGWMHKEYFSDAVPDVLGFGTQHKCATTVPHRLQAIAIISIRLLA